MSDTTSKAPKAVVTAAEILGASGKVITPDLKDAGNVKNYAPLSEKEKAGLRLAHWTGIIGAVLVLIIIGNFIYNMSALPKAPLLDKDLIVSPKNLPDAEALLGYYKTINDLTADRTAKIFDIVITKTILPIFTLLLGFVFGSKVEQHQKSDAAKD